MNYTINNNEINLLQAKKVIEEVQELQKSLNDEGYELDFDQVFKLYTFNQIDGKLEDIIPVE